MGIDAPPTRTKTDWTKERERFKKALAKVNRAASGVSRELGLSANALTWLNTGKNLSSEKVAILMTWVEMVEEGLIDAKPGPKRAKAASKDAVTVAPTPTQKPAEKHEPEPLSIEPTPADIPNPYQTMFGPFLNTVLLEALVERRISVPDGIRLRVVVEAAS